jgi:hypothetical protein
MVRIVLQQHRCLAGLEDLGQADALLDHLLLGMPG